MWIAFGSSFSLFGEVEKVFCFRRLFAFVVEVIKKIEFFGRDLKSFLTFGHRNTKKWLRIQEKKKLFSFAKKKKNFVIIGLSREFATFFFGSIEIETTFPLYPKKDLS